jgi:GNAT superfamily N-acetyltransferase
MTARVYSKAPNECSAKELAGFAALVVEGGQVNSGGLPARMALAHSLIFLEQEDALIGVAALKRPLHGYRLSVSKKAGYELPEAEYPFELGWIFVDSSKRGKGHSAKLVDHAVKLAKGAGLFATSATENHPMHKTLRRADFTAKGKPYRSTEREGDVQLFVRHKS